MYRTRQIRIKKKRRLWQYAHQMCIASACLYNRANYLVRQYATAVRDFENMKPLNSNQMEVFLLINGLTRGTKYAPKGRWLTYGQLDYILKVSEDSAYRSLPAQSNQQILKRLIRDYKSFFEAFKAWQQNPDRFTGRPKLPGYKKRGEAVTAVFTNQICRITDGHSLKFPGTKDRLELGPVPENARLKEVRVKPCHGELVADVVLETAENTVKRGLLTGLEEASLRKILCGEEAAGYRVAAIDPGVDNFCAVTNNFGAAPFLIKGGAIKSENRYYNKKMAVLRSEAMRCNGRWETRRTGRLTNRRNRILKDLLHKASRRIADWAEENRADLVILGHNVFQKQRVSMGRANNQTFVQIPYSVFAGMLRYKLEEKGIAFLETEESYTSKADYLAGDRIPTYGKNLKDNPPVFSGKRIKRGLYLHYDGTRSNADINGAANILRKVIPNLTGWDRGAVDAPYVVRIA